MNLKGHPKFVIDSTIPFPPGDSLLNAKLPLVTTTQFRSDTEEDLSWDDRSQDVCYDTGDIDPSFDIMGKFSSDDKNYLFPKGGKATFSHNSRYNFEDDFDTSATGVVFLRYKYIIDFKGNLLEVDRMNEHSTLEKKYQFQYDDKQLLTESKIFTGSNLAKQVEYSYDKNNNETGYTICDENKTVVCNFSFTYEAHDTAGNWQKRIKYKNDEPIIITYRRIKYF
jgi:hypothetical protein